jgi:hypothetical protein
VVKKPSGRFFRRSEDLFRIAAKQGIPVSLLQNILAMNRGDVIIQT